MWGSLVGAVVVAALWTALLVASSQGLSERRRAYLFGVGSAASAYVVAILATIIIASLFPATPGWVGVIVLAPLIEESARLVGADTAYRRGNWGQWAAFGVGYALFEAGLKLADGVALVATSGLEHWLRILTPIVPFLLHVFLSMLMCLLLHRGASLLGAYLVTLGLHAAHNGSVVFLSASYSSYLLVALILQCLLYSALIWVIIRHSKTAPSGSVEASG
jgi:hypothetical protein